MVAVEDEFTAGQGIVTLPIPLFVGNNITVMIGEL
jgi:hypothetical protein